MADEMNHIERAMAGLSNQPVDRLLTYPLAMGVCRRLINGTGITYQEWVSDPKKFAQAFIEGQRRFDFDFAIGLMDLSVMAGDLGAHVRMDEQNTPFVDDPLIKDIEGYEKLEVPNIKDPKTRSYVLVEGTGMFVEALGKEVVTAAFLEGPLLALTQTRGAEFVFKDMYDNDSSRKAVHAALKTITDYDKEMVKAFAEKKPAGLVWDYLWGSYSCLGDTEYEEFEGDYKYAGCLNELVQKEGMANCIHNCADLPHLDTQIKKWKPAIYSMAYYPLIPGSPSAKEVIQNGYADVSLVGGNIDPQGFVRWKPEKMEEVTKKLCNEVLTELKARGLGGRYCIASGCEVPPALSTKLENIQACVDATKKYGVWA
ncbi:MAG: uroporphyrinogen decarboxylase family protein [Methanomassiliicoccaceae archaeon]|jgi:uroporphyrinogen decarboxylase|nr:uroporphyrinogen decarboxylase family protein [Methanomassiliicoccaceae archaeon]HOL07171.1 uroporphyrinogen decarboxylase family protein [Methanomassiliicoccaceae archaeon]HOQ25862.1 uroporphyrinogen decarboxylase family protein [Methanomassiliicoccaceae archaeon]HQA20501.1 uroporphyrinogen decarboxylase family protein [Methanomassiliicoccaceae archaeon]HQD87257.1 uroporphyrinogen decarboxylase family protein [Methanomassiliicoccaceae archaeon]